MSMDTPAPTNPTTTSKAANKIAKTANGLSDRADTKITELARKAELAAQRAETVLHDGVETLRTKSREYADDAAERIERAQQRLVEQVRERPQTAIIAAAGIGLVLGLLIAGGRRH